MTGIIICVWNCTWMNLKNSFAGLCIAIILTAIEKNVWTIEGFEKGEFLLTTDMNGSMNSGAAPWLVVSNKVINRYREDAMIYSVKIDSASEYEESILNQAAELTEDIPAISRTSKVELAKSLEETKGALSKLSAFLTIMLFTMGILNFINTMSVSILGRQRGFVSLLISVIFTPDA